MPSRRRGGPFAAGLLALLLAAGCGDGAPAGGTQAPAIAEVARLHGDERADELARLAKAERGKLRLYTTLDERIVGDVLERFTADTGIAVTLYRTKSEELLERVAREARADVDGADVVEANGAGLRSLDRAGVLTPIAPDDPDALVDGADRGGWVVSRSQWFVVSRNTKAVAAGERPRSVAELADRRWKGRIALEAGDWDWYVTLREHWMRTEGLTGDEADERFEAIARNARVVDGHGFQSQLVSSGEFDVAAADYAYVVEAVRKAGGPIAWEPPAGPIVSRDNGVAIPRRARRPAKALMFADWLLGPGQRVLARLGVAPARRDLLTTPGVPVLEIDDAILGRQREASRVYRRITRLAGKGPAEED
jgi:iron(III) transport system substrate-binding protein